MPNQALSFAELLGGGIMLTAGITGYSITDVIAGKAVTVKPIASVKVEGSSTGGGAAAGGAAGGTANAALATAGGYVFPYAATSLKESRVDRGQDIDSSQAHPSILALGNAVVKWAEPGQWPEVGIQLLDGPLAGRQVFYGHVNSIAAGIRQGVHVRAGQVLGTGGGSSEGGYPGHIEIGLWPPSSVAGGTHYTSTGQEFHDLLHRLWPGKIGARAIIAG